MNIKRAKEEIKNTIEAYLLRDRYGAYEIPPIRQRPVLLIGPPGVGKTQIMEQISQECRIGLVSYTITHHTRQSAIGLPFIQDRIYDSRRCSVTEYTMSEIVASIYDKIADTGLSEGILFIDEINCVSETLAPTMLQFLQCKTFGNHSIPQGWIIVAAGNPPEYNKSVREFDIVTLDRIKMIPVEADFGVWREYAQQVHIHPAVISYLDVKKQNFCRIETNVDGKLFATPRGWEDLSRLIEVYEKLHKTVDREVVFQYIQYPLIAKDFANYLELYYKYEKDYQVEAILDGQVKEAVYSRLERAPFDERMSVISLVLAALNSGFQSLQEKERRLERLEKIFRRLKPKGMKGTDAGGEDAGRTEYDSPAEYLAGLTAGMQAERKYKLESKLLSRKEDYLYQDVTAVLEKVLQVIKAESRQTEEEVWEKVSEIFDAENEAYEVLFELCGGRLEHAFDFMEAAFGSGQEMVVFVTGLNTGFYSVDFLQEYECQRYYQYNKMLLFDDREREILKQMES
mgnify:FL=1|jgi:hypothetical protein